MKAFNSPVILVGPDGIVLASDQQIAWWMFMEYAVERFFEGELK